VVADTALAGVANAWANSVAVTPWAQAHGAPTFTQFAVSDTFTARPAAVDFSSLPTARRYRTVLLQGAKAGPNFAGHFTVIYWGCGSPCVQFAIVDARNGNVAWYEPDSTYVGPPMYRRDSRLLIEDPTGFETDSLGHPYYSALVAYYEWTGTALILRDTLNADHVRLPAK
jgi:hypothetical protein